MLSILLRGWDGGWDHALEAACLELLVAVDDDLVGMLQTMRTMLRAMSPSAEADLADMQVGL
jgi:hypothetical protein